MKNKKAKFLLILSVILFTSCTAVLPPDSSTESDTDPLTDTSSEAPATTEYVTAEATETTSDTEAVQTEMTLRERIIADSKVWTGADFFDTVWLEYLPVCDDKPKLLCGFSNYQLAKDEDNPLELSVGVWTVYINDEAQTLLSVEVGDGNSYMLSALEPYNGDPGTLGFKDVEELLESDPRFTGKFDMSEPKSNQYLTVVNLSRDNHPELGEMYEPTLAQTSEDGRFTVAKDEDSGNLYVIDSNNSAITLVCKGELNGTQDYKNPTAWRFIGNKLYYSIYLYESSGGVYTYDCLTGENIQVSKYNALGIFDGILYTFSDPYSHGAFAVYYHDGVTEQKLELDDYVKAEYSDHFSLKLDEQSGELHVIDDNFVYHRYFLNGDETKLIQSIELDDRFCTPQEIELSTGGIAVIRCGLRAGCDEYLYLISRPTT